MNAQERTKALLDYCSLNAQQFAMRIGAKTKQSIYDLLMGKTRNISENMASKIISAFPELNRVWLLTGEGEMLRADVDTTPQAEADAPAPAFGRVPLIPVGAFAGEVSGVAADGTDFSLCERVPSPVPGCDIAIDVSGDSMEPDFPNGCRVFCRRIDDEVFIAWGAVFVLDTCNGAFIKRLLPGPDDTCIEARSLNADYPPFRVPKSAIYGVYRVLASFRGYSAT